MRVESYIQGFLRCNLDREGKAQCKGVIRPKPSWYLGHTQRNISIIANSWRWQGAGAELEEYELQNAAPRCTTCACINGW